MREFRVEWTKCPTAYNATNVLFIEANSKEDAEAVARDHIERKLGIGDWLKIVVTEPVQVPAGRVVKA